MKKSFRYRRLMIDYCEMTSFNFDSLDYKQVKDLQKITDSEYANKPYSFKYGKFDLVDLFHSFISTKEN